MWKMAFKQYKFKCWKKEIRKLLRQRLLIKDKVRYHKRKLEEFEDKILPKIEEELEGYLKRAGN